MSTWHTPDELLKEFKIIILERDNDNIEEIIDNDKILKQNIDSFIILKNIKKIQLSASYVRELVKNGQSIKGLVPEKIENKVLRVYR